MDDDEMHALDIRDFEIERRLEAYARARLSPDPITVARTRARVMREARLQFEAARSAAADPSAALAAHRPLARRVAIPLLAASLWAGVVVGSVAAAQAGGPLYPTRLLIESATLPADGPARATAELDRLDARLAEAMGAAVRGDSDAVSAALGAYRQIADDAIAEAAGDGVLETRVQTALERHVAVLTAVRDSLEAKGNTTAANAVETAIQRAIEHNAAVVAGLANDGGANGGGPGAGATGNGQSGSGANGATGGTGQTGTGQTGNGGTGNGQTGNGQTGNGANGNGANGADGGTGQTGNGPDENSKPSKDPKPTPTAPGAAPTPNHTPRGQNP
jgi:hypothetical protein